MKQVTFIFSPQALNDIEEAKDYYDVIGSIAVRKGNKPLLFTFK